jgi:hypothetical protein
VIPSLFTSTKGVTYGSEDENGSDGAVITTDVPVSIYSKSKDANLVRYGTSNPIFGIGLGCSY